MRKRESERERGVHGDIPRKKDNKIGIDRMAFY